MNDKPLPLDDRTIITEDGREALPGQEVCDFCLSTEIAFEYDDAEPVTIESGGRVNVSVDGWAACARCHDLIEAEDTEGLLQRAVEGIRTRQDQSGAIDLTALMLTISQFMDGRGEPRKL